MRVVWLLALVLWSGASRAAPAPAGGGLVAQADEEATPKPKKKKKKKAEDAPKAEEAAPKGDDAAKPSQGLISDLDDAATPKPESEGEPRAASIKLGVGEEQKLTVSGLASAEIYDDLAGEVSTSGDELKVKALSAGRTKVVATLKDGTTKTWVLEVTEAKGK